MGEGLPLYLHHIPFFLGYAHALTFRKNLKISNTNNNNVTSFVRKRHLSTISGNSCLGTLNMDKLFTLNSRDTRHHFCFIHKFMKLCFEILNSTVISLLVIYHFLRSEYNRDREAPKRVRISGRLQQTPLIFRSVVDCRSKSLSEYFGSLIIWVR